MEYNKEYWKEKYKFIPENLITDKKSFIDMIKHFNDERLNHFYKTDMVKLKRSEHYVYDIDSFIDIRARYSCKSMYSIIHGLYSLADYTVIKDQKRVFKRLNELFKKDVYDFIEKLKQE